MRLGDYLRDVRWIQYSPDLARVFTPTGSILLCWLIWKTRDCGATVEATREQIMTETGLSERNVETAIERLKDGGVLVVTMKRLEHRTFYTVDSDALEAAWGAARERTKCPVERKDAMSSPERTQCPLDIRVRTEVPERKNKEPDKEPPADLLQDPTQEAVAVWIQAYNASNPQPYCNAMAKRRKADAAAMASLLKAGVTPERIAATAKQMFEVAGHAVNGKAAWWATRCRTVENFALHLNEIEGELNAISQSKRRGSSGGSRTAGTANDTTDNPYAGL